MPSRKAEAEGSPHAGNHWNVVTSAWVALIYSVLRLRLKVELLKLYILDRCTAVLYAQYLTPSIDGGWKLVHHVGLRAPFDRRMVAAISMGLKCTPLDDRC